MHHDRIGIYCTLLPYPLIDLLCRKNSSCILIILGDVNAGAEVIAGDNVVVVGNLRGLAHAGAKGNKQAIVAANRIDTPQLRIANIIKEMVKDDDAYNVAYTYAYVNENGREIILE